MRRHVAPVPIPVRSSDDEQGWSSNIWNRQENPPFIQQRLEPRQLPQAGDRGAGRGGPSGDCGGPGGRPRRRVARDGRRVQAAQDAASGHLAGRRPATVARLHQADPSRRGRRCSSASPPSPISTARWRREWPACRRWQRSAGSARPSSRAGCSVACCCDCTALALGGARAIFFQNPADRDLFLEQRIARPGAGRGWSPGRGSTSTGFSPPPVLAAMASSASCWSRGCCATRGSPNMSRRRGSSAARIPRSRFQLLGGAGGDNPSAVPESELARWAAEAIVEQLGVSEDVRPHIAAADCIVLPSYREGLPRSLLEGAAMARPLIATDVPGCRDVVEDGVNGLLCEARSAASLAAAMERMLAMSPDRALGDGCSGRGARSSRVRPERWSPTPIWRRSAAMSGLLSLLAESPRDVATPSRAFPTAIGSMRSATFMAVTICWRPAGEDRGRHRRAARGRSDDRLPWRPDRPRPGFGRGGRAAAHLSPVGVRLDIPRRQS